MNRELNKIDLGELEFQLEYYTELTAKTIAHGTQCCQIALIEEFEDNTSICYCIIQIQTEKLLFKIHGIYTLFRTDKITMQDINRAIKSVNDRYRNLYDYNPACIDPKYQFLD